MTMGERITALRKGRGMTQEQLAEKLSVTRQSVSKWELDQATPEVGFAVALCGLFGVSLDYLIRGIEAEPVVEAEPDKESAPASEKTESGQALPSPKSRPLTAKGYAILLGSIFFLAQFLCLNLYPVAVLLNQETDFAMIFVLLYAIVIPLPAVYCVTNRWWYADRGCALKHLWKMTAGVAVVGNLLFLGGFEFYCCHVHQGLEYAFWQTDWIMAEYHWLVGEIVVMAILLPILVCFRHKKWLCWLAYALSWLAFFWSNVALDALMRLIPTGLGYYWGLASVGMYFLVMVAVFLSQFLVYRLLRGSFRPEEQIPPKPVRVWHLGGLAVLCAAAMVSVAGGLHYALDLVALPTAYLPAVYVLIPLLVLLLTWGRRVDTTRTVWRAALLSVGIFVPCMLLGHMGVCYFFQRFYACLGNMPDLNWGSYFLASVFSALIGCAVALPAMIALRKRPWACIGGASAVMLLAVAATLLLPRILI